MSFNTILLNIAYGLFVFALLFRDILWLRIFALCSSLGFLTFGAIQEIRPMFLWNIVFSTINTIMLIRLILERRPIYLSKELEEIYQKVFNNMSRREFLNFWGFAQPVAFKNELLCKQGKFNEELFFILKGEVDVNRDGKTITRLPRLHFAAEMSFFTGNPASADVNALGKVDVMVWSQEKLHQLKQVNPPLFSKLQAILGRDLTEKLKKH